MVKIFTFTSALSSESSLQCPESFCKHGQRLFLFRAEIKSVFSIDMNRVNFPLMIESFGLTDVLKTAGDPWEAAI